MSRSSAAVPRRRPHRFADTGMCTAQEAERLFHRWRVEGDADAREEIFIRHVPIARRLAGKYWPPGEPSDDLLQVASMGLLAAIDRFDPDRGVPFVAFAVPTVLGELRRHFRDATWPVHVPRHSRELAMQVEAATRELEATAVNPPRPAEVAERLHIDLDQVRIGLEAGAARHCLSLDAPAHRARPSRITRGDALGAVDDRYALIEMAMALRHAVRQLTTDEQRALSLRVGDELTQSEIAGRLGCSQTQVSRLLRTGERKLLEVIGIDGGPGRWRPVSRRICRRRSTPRRR